MPTHTVHFVTSETINPDYRKAIQGILRAYNEQAATIRGPEAKPLNIQVNDAQGQLLGGMVAATYWGWLVIDLLAVVEQARGQGLGKALMEQAESDARRPRLLTRPHQHLCTSGTWLLPEARIWHYWAT